MAPLQLQPLGCRIFASERLGQRGKVRLGLGPSIFGTPTWQWQWQKFMYQLRPLDAHLLPLNARKQKNSTSKGQIEASKPLLPDMDKLFLVDQLEKNMAKAARAAGLQAVWLGQQGQLDIKLHRHHWQVPATLLVHPLLGPNAEVDQPQLNS